MGFPSPVPSPDGWFTCVAVVLAVDALLKGFAGGCIVGTAELFGAPKLNTGLSRSGVAAATGGLDGGAAVGLLVIPKLNFGFDASPVPPVGGALAIGLVLVLVKVGGLVGCANEKGLWGAGPLP